ncbi:MAG: efflux RND transporter periplasmic adaptor subunit [Acidobacteria bacterium]|nr:efflux RND transporter periplasmic adaptor subunit [Acidobacteriota bacterium]
MSRIVAAALVALACAAAAPAAPPPGNVVARGDLDRRLVLAGTLSAQRAERHAVPLTSSWRQTIKWLIDEGTAVEPGQAIARLDPADLARRIEEREIALIRQRQQRLVQDSAGRRERLELQLKLEQARVEFEKARVDAAVPEPMVGSKNHHERRLALEKAERAHAQAGQALATAEANLASSLRQLDLDLAQDEAELARLNENLDSLTVRAASAGIVIYERHAWYDRKVRIGDTVNPMQGLVQIPDIATIEVEAWAGEADVTLLAPGQRVAVRLDAFPERAFAGHVRAVNPTGEQRESFGSSRYFRVAIALESIDAAIMKPGMSAECEIAVAALRDVLLAPLAAVEIREGRPWLRPAGADAVAVEPLGFDEFRLAFAPAAGLAAGTELEVAGGAR